MFYFAYGMNMDPGYMPGAVEVGPAFLHVCRLDFRTYADVSPFPNESVPGALWSIDRKQLAELDRREHVPTLYVRDEATVDGPDGQVEAWVYTMEGRYEISPPSPAYLQVVARGYDHFGHDKTVLSAAVLRAQIEEHERWTVR